MNIIKKITLWGWLVAASAVFTLIALIIYGVTSSTGYLPSIGESWSVAPLLLSLLAVILSCALVVLKPLQQKSWITSIVLYAILALLIASFVLFVNARVQGFSDCYFIPLAPPAAEASMMSASIAGMVFYILAIVAVIATAFGGKLQKEEE